MLFNEKQTIFSCDSKAIYFNTALRFLILLPNNLKMNVNEMLSTHCFTSVSIFCYDDILILLNSFFGTVSIRNMLSQETWWDEHLTKFSRWRDRQKRTINTGDLLFAFLWNYMFIAPYKAYLQNWSIKLKRLAQRRQ